MTIPILGSGARGGVYHAPYSGHRDTIAAILMDLFAGLRSRQVCEHPDRVLYAECCEPDALRCNACQDLYARRCLDCCACGAPNPRKPSSRKDNDLIIAEAGRIVVCGSFCGRCARVVRELHPGTRSVRI